MRGLYIVAAVTMAGVSSVFALLAEIEKTYGIAERDLGWIAGSAFIGALITQLWLSRYADRGHGTLLLRGGILAATAGLLWFGFATELWQFVIARLILGAGTGKGPILACDAALAPAPADVAAGSREADLDPSQWPPPSVGAVAGPITEPSGWAITSRGGRS